MNSGATIRFYITPKLFKLTLSKYPSTNSTSNYKLYSIIMKKIFTAAFFSFLIHHSFSQQLGQVIIAGNGNLSSFSFLAEQGLIINLGSDGIIKEWGTALEPGRMGYFPGKLQAFMGKVEYYGQGSDSAFKGKIRSLGTCNITYYPSYENKMLAGKIKTIGSLNMDYYREQEDNALKGKLKSAGPVSISYYTSFDNEYLREKLKSISSTSLSYYTSFDDKVIRGKIKSIGSFSYTWYTSFERKEFQGLMKSGSMAQVINGINYIITY